MYEWFPCRVPGIEFSPFVVCIYSQGGAVSVGSIVGVDMLINYTTTVLSDVRFVGNTASCYDTDSAKGGALYVSTGRSVQVDGQQGVVGEGGRGQTLEGRSHSPCNPYSVTNLQLWPG